MSQDFNIIVKNVDESTKSPLFMNPIIIKTASTTIIIINELVGRYSKDIPFMIKNVSNNFL